MSIRVFDLKFSEAEENEFAQGSINILREGFLTNHTQTRLFENTFAKRQQTKHALAVSSGTAALEIAFRAINVKDRYVIVPTNTFIATGAAIVNAGGIPYIIDIEPTGLGISPDQLNLALEKLTPNKIAAIAVVHIGGHIAPSFQSILSKARMNDIPVVEDCAQATFASLDNELAGNHGDISCFSFFTTKTMTTGEGGMVVTNNPDLYQRSLQIRRFGMSLEDPTVHTMGGSNFKMTEFSALLGLIELKRVDSRIERRRHLARIYQEQLNPTFFKCFGDIGSSYSTHYKQIVLLNKGGQRDQLEQYLSSFGIPFTGGVYNTPLHKQPAMNQFVSSSQDFGVSDFFSANHFCPPCYPELLDQQVLSICGKINDWNPA
tara:strand:- start:11209 stop:12336 length:1128 start_codon:yes stop_codon:yes gene_type:complete